MSRLFNVDNERDTMYLHGVIDALTEKNSSDKDIITRLQELYDTSCWFSVISFAEEVIYG